MPAEETTGAYVRWQTSHAVKLSRSRWPFPRGQK